MDIVILTNYGTALNFRQLDQFQLDLGRSLINRKTEKVEIHDQFLLDAERETGRLPQRIGNYGTLNFYYDNQIENGLCQFWTHKKIYEAQIEPTQDLKTWLSKHVQVAVQKASEDNDNNSSTEGQ